MTPAPQNGELSHRQNALLLAAVQEFINTAEPVGSQQLAARHHLGVRAAMVRNLMGELEEAGFLKQPHTSAGRVPTDRAFRYYVDHLTPSSPIDFHDRAQIELHYSAPPADFNEIVRDTSRLLALMTGQAALVMAPSARIGDARAGAVRAAARVRGDGGLCADNRRRAEPARPDGS